MMCNPRCRVGLRLYESQAAAQTAGPPKPGEAPDCFTNEDCAAFRAGIFRPIFAPHISTPFVISFLLGGCVNFTLAFSRMPRVKSALQLFPPNCHFYESTSNRRNRPDPAARNY